jgi:CDP-diacylglycerol pyrophosphatase
VNSLKFRTQDQLHIHIDCVRADVRSALAANVGRLGGRWSPFPVRLAGHRYGARWVAGTELGQADPFKLLAQEDADAQADMSRESLVVIGASGPEGEPGFVLLSHRDGPELNGAGEALLDHACRGRA